MDNLSKIKDCPHNKTVLRVIESVATCETTAVFCTECNEQLSEPKIEC